ncbi:Protein YIPF [Aphelenchoides besseyi]|nr:Protein YIPF [Aphelenchoides besseyi]KAI6193709.1 Protein YIPF [Aphelenchoides besseyi]
MNNEPSLNVALDLEMLEKEIQSKEQNRSNAYNDLSGSIGGVAAARRTQHSSDPVDAITDFDTLDEPVMVTIKRDARLIGAKFIREFDRHLNVHVQFRSSDATEKPKLSARLGSLGTAFRLCHFIVVGFDFRLLQDTYSGKGPRFTEAFTLVFFGSCVVTANIKLLGGKISFFQSLCVIGYCLLPSVFASIACHLFHFEKAMKLSMFLRLLCSAFGFGWSTYASTAFLAAAQPEGRRFLTTYPMILFYFVVAWLVFSNS